MLDLIWMRVTSTWSHQRWSCLLPSLDSPVQSHSLTVESDAEEATRTLELST